MYIRLSSHFRSLLSNSGMRSIYYVSLCYSVVDGFKVFCGVRDSPERSHQRFARVDSDPRNRCLSIVEAEYRPQTFDDVHVSALLEVEQDEDE